MGCNLYRERHSSHARALARMHDQGHTHEVHACAQLWAGGQAGRQAGRHWRYLLWVCEIRHEPILFSSSELIQLESS